MRLAPALQQASWETASLGYLVTTRYGHPFASGKFNADGVGVPIVRIRDVLPNRIQTWAAESPPRSAWVEDGDLVVGMDGDFNHVLWNGGRAALNQRVCALDAGPRLDLGYLSYVISFPLQTINDTVHYTTVKHLSFGDLLREQVPVPPLEVQRRIADYLDTEVARIDTLIAKNEHAAKLVEERRVAYIERAFWAPEWPRRGLAYVCDPSRPIRYGIVLPGPSVDDGVPLIKGGDVHRQTLGQGTDCMVSRDVEAGHRKSRVEPGDLVYTIRGSYGDVAAVPESMPMANVTQDVARIAPRDVSRDWLLYALDAPSARSFADIVATGATIKGVNIGDLRSMPVPVPDEVVQRRLVEEADDVTSRLRATHDRLAEQRELLRERRRALVTAAVTGEIEV